MSTKIFNFVYFYISNVENYNKTLKNKEICAKHHNIYMFICYGISYSLFLIDILLIRQGHAYLFDIRMFICFNVFYLYKYILV